MPLNITHRSDYYFGGEDGKTRQFSRKQSGELLGNIDEAEDQLRDYYNNADENYQIVEGIISSTPLASFTPRQYFAIKGGGISIRELRRDTRGRIPEEAITIRSSFDDNIPSSLSPNSYLYAYRVEMITDKFGESIGQLIGSTYRVSSSMLYAWLYRLDQAGITTFYTEDYVATAKLLIAIYRNCQKPPEEHTTLQRIIKPRITIRTPREMTKEELEKYNYTKTLMGIAGAGLGESKARALIDHFGSPVAVFTASVEEIASVEGFGKKTAEKILRAIGREAALNQDKEKTLQAIGKEIEAKQCKENTFRAASKEVETNTTERKQ